MAPFGTDAMPGVMQRILQDQPDLPALPEPLRSVVGACVAKDPALRRSAQTAHDRLLGHPTPIQSLTTPTSPTRFRWAAIAGVGVVIAVSAVAVAMPQGGGRSAAATRSASPTPAVYGSAVTIDTGRGTGWHTCVQIGGHVVGTPDTAHGPISRAS